MRRHRVRYGRQRISTIAHKAIYTVSETATCCVPWQNAILKKRKKKRAFTHFYKFRRPTPNSSLLYATKADMRFFGQAEKLFLNMRFPLKMRFVKTSTQTVQTTLHVFFFLLTCLIKILQEAPKTSTITNEIKQTMNSFGRVKNLPEGSAKRYEVQYYASMVYSFQLPVLIIWSLDRWHLHLNAVSGRHRNLVPCFVQRLRSLARTRTALCLTSK